MTNKQAEIYHFDLYGKREDKYDFLNNNSIDSINWNKLEPEEPYFFFVPKDFGEQKSYDLGFKVDELFSLTSNGIEVGREQVGQTFSEKELLSIKYDIETLSVSEFRAKYIVKDSRDWVLELYMKDLQTSNKDMLLLQVKPFDFRKTFFTGTSRGFHTYPAITVNKHVFKKDNLVFITTNQAAKGFKHVFISKTLSSRPILDNSGLFGTGRLFPLYLYPDSNNDNTASRTPNLNMEIVNKISDGLGMEFVAEKENATTQKIHKATTPAPPKEGNRTDSKNSPPLEGCPKDGVVDFPITFAPIDILDYIYAVLHSPTYREKYKEFLKIDFPRVPYPKEKEVFWQLVKFGGELRQIHLLESSVVDNYITQYPIDGSNEVEKIKFDKTSTEKIQNATTEKIQNATTPAPPKEGNWTLGKNSPPLEGCPKDGVVDFPITFAPIDILDYIYAVLHSPTYREKYKEFLKIDFPRVPYPKEKEVFWQLVKFGGELRQIHLLESPVVDNYITQYPIDGNNEVVKPVFKDGSVFINDTQYFANVPEVAWNFYIGGYQPAQKWLKDRKGRKLEFEDIMHYQKIIVALTETDRIMKKIDEIEIE